MEKFLAENKDAIIKRWLDLIVGAYPADAAQFYKREKDPFANPVGTTIAREIATIYDELLGGMEYQNLYGPLDHIVRIRAVQDFTPANALGFVFLLKKAVRDELAASGQEPADFKALLEFEGRIDQTALLAFEIYMGCREQIWQLKANELKNRTIKLLERTNLFVEEADREMDKGDSKEGKGK